MITNVFSVLLLQSVFALLVQATIYITQPLPGTVCNGGKSCTVEWVDDGVAPLLSDIGACHVALYNGNEKLIQELNPVDVSAQHALEFTPDAKAGPNSNFYYINFTSVNPVDGATYSQFSTMFTLNSMKGSFSSIVASDTSPVPVPSSLTSSYTKPVTSTTTVSPSVSSLTASAGATSSSSSSSSSSSFSSASNSSTTKSSSSSSSRSKSASSTSSSNSSSSPSSISSSSSSSSSSTSSGFVTSSTSPATTLTVAASAAGSVNSATTVPTAPTSTSSTTGASAASSAFQNAATTMPVFLSSLVALAFGLLI